MGMLSAGEAVQTGLSLAAVVVVGDHAAHGQLHSLGGTLGHQGTVDGGLQVTDPAGVALPLLLLQLLAGQDSLSAVDDDDVVTTVHVGGEGGLVLTAQQNSGLGSNTTQGFAGGGVTGQAGAIRHGVARALLQYDSENLRSTLKKAGFLTRDARMKERKKYGLKAARRAPQFSKR